MNKIFLFLLFSNSIFAQQNLQLQLNEVKNLSSGSYNITFQKHSKVIVQGDVIFVNVNNFIESEIEIISLGNLLIESSLNLNGKSILNNKGKLSIQNLELQNGNNRLINSGKIEFAEAQINDNTSTIELEGCNSTFDVKGSFNLNTTKVGALTLKDGANVTTTNLNIGGANTVAGKGLIKVKHINLNHNLTTSSEINLCYKGHLNQPEKLGAANLSCDAVLCSPLPVKVSQVLFKKKDDMIEWEFNLIDADGTDSFDVMLSDDAKTWSTVLHVEIDKVNPNKKYSGTIKLKLK